MKKIKDLDPETSLKTIKVVLPTDVYEMSSLPKYDITSREVYLQGWIMGDFFVKVDLNSTQVYPMFWDAVPTDIDEWEVVSID